MQEPKTLRCDMEKTCAAQVTHIDPKGFVYCTPHGERRQQSRRCRKLRPAKSRKLEKGEMLTKY